ncbi:MAG: hypothetical protein ABI824_00995 [Acidobacteriota bacterium]
MLFSQTTPPVVVPLPTSLAFTWQSGATLPTAKSLAVKAGTSTSAYVVTTNPTSTPWLSLAPESGHLPAATTVRVNPSGLGVGIYASAIIVTVGGINLPATIPVTLTVTPPLPSLSLSSTTLSFTSPPNPPVTQTILLNTSGDPIPFTAAAQGATWLTVSPKSGVVLPGFPTTLTVSVDTSTLTPQATTYTGKLVIAATGVPSTNKSQNIDVSVLVNALTPTVSSIWPTAALVNTGPLTLTVRGTGYYKGTSVKVRSSPTPLKTTFISATTLLADVPASLLTAAGTLNIIATNPAPGGDSTAAAFTVSSTPVVQAVVSSASYSTAPVSPGELVTLFGTGIGPTTPSTMSVISGFVGSTLQNTTVAIDGRSAPAICVSRDQITVQVPYATSIGTARAVAVNNGGVVATGSVDVAATSPGMFALDGSGQGQAAALVFSMSTSSYAVNGPTAVAHAGDIMLLYITGEGDFATAITPRTGYVIPSTLNPLPQVNPLPTVTIGGLAATVQYAGPVVGGVLGLLQINAVVPTGVPTGLTVPVVVTIGGVSSQTGVTLVIK